MSWDIYDEIEILVDKRGEVNWQNYIVYFKDKTIYEVGANSVAEAISEALDRSDKERKDIDKVCLRSYTVKKSEDKLYENKDYSDKIVQEIKKTLYDNENFVSLTGIKWYDWVGDGHSFIVEDVDGELYRVSIFKEEK